MNSHDYRDYRDDYSDAGFWSKLSKCATKMGSKLVYYVLILYYVMKAPGTPWGVKAQIVGALGYVILPLDLIPDFIPVAGFSDDLGAVVYTVGTVSDYVTPDIDRKAKAKVRDIFGSDDGCSLAA